MLLCLLYRLYRLYLPYLCPMPYHLVCLLDRSGLHVRALDSHDWRSTSLRQARGVLNLGVWETSSVFCRRLGGAPCLCLAGRLLKTRYIVFVSRSKTDQEIQSLRSDPWTSRVCQSLHPWDCYYQSHVCGSLVGRLLPCLLTSSCRRSFCAGVVMA